MMTKEGRGQSYKAQQPRGRQTLQAATAEEARWAGKLPEGSGKCQVHSQPQRTDRTQASGTEGKWGPGSEGSQGSERQGDSEAVTWMTTGF